MASPLAGSRSQAWAVRGHHTWLGATPTCLLLECRLHPCWTSLDSSATEEFEYCDKQWV